VPKAERISSGVYSIQQSITFFTNSPSFPINPCLLASLSLRRSGPTGRLPSRALLLGLGGAMVVLLVHGLVDTPYFKNDLSVLFWLIIGLGIIEDKIYQGRILTKT